jgi:Ca2+-binding RTX toxin-like protein
MSKMSRLTGTNSKYVSPGGIFEEALFGKGHEGSENLSGSAGNDYMYAGLGDDLIWGHSGDDIITGGAGNDTIYGGKGNDSIYAGWDDEGNDHYFGNSGNDIFVVGHGVGSDSYVGGSGFDTIDYSGTSGGTGSVAVDLSKHTVKMLQLGKVDAVRGIEKVIGTQFDDTLIGDKKANVLFGGTGLDVIRGGSGSDVLSGGSASDVFTWMKSDAGAGRGVDHITDFGYRGVGRGFGGDKLDFHSLVESQKFANISDVVKVTDGAQGSKVAVKIGGAFVDIVVLDGVHGHTAAELLKAGMILV